MVTGIRTPTSARAGQRRTSSTSWRTATSTSVSGWATSNGAGKGPPLAGINAHARKKQKDAAKAAQQQHAKGLARGGTSAPAQQHAAAAGAFFPDLDDGVCVYMLASGDLHSSAARSTSAWLMSVCLCRAATPTHGAWRRHLLRHRLRWRER